MRTFVSSHKDEENGIDELSTGPVVRIAPNEISFGDPKAGLTIYNVKTKFPKVCLS